MPTTKTLGLFLSVACAGLIVTPICAAPRQSVARAVASHDIAGSRSASVETLRYRMAQNQKKSTSDADFDEAAPPKPDGTRSKK